MSYTGDPGTSLYDIYRERGGLLDQRVFMDLTGQQICLCNQLYANRGSMSRGCRIARPSPLTGFRLRVPAQCGHCPAYTSIRYPLKRLRELRSLLQYDKPVLK